MLWLVVLALLAGCGGASMKSPQYSGGYSNAKSSSYPTAAATGTFSASDQAAPSTPSGGYASSGEREESAPPPPAMEPGTGSTTAQSEPPPENRPGLGTEWGETRSSHVRDVSFFRADPDRPFAVASLFYNDRPGVEALAGYHGGGPSFHEFATRGGILTVSIHDGNGSPLEALNVGGRTYVVGQAGERYTISITNHTAHRFELVATVDGLDVINGRPGDLTNRGYVILPYATLDIDGFRQTHDEVATFRFGRVADSYAAQTGSARNVGVIGLAFFSERGDEYSEQELETRDTANPFPAADPRFARPPR
jgi:hypothetical protein